jgi:hypothetical protein
MPILCHSRILAADIPAPMREVKSRDEFMSTPRQALYMHRIHINIHNVEEYHAIDFYVVKHLHKFTFQTYDLAENIGEHEGSWITCRRTYTSFNMLGTIPHYFDSMYHQYPYTLEKGRALQVCEFRPNHNGKERWQVSLYVRMDNLCQFFGANPLHNPDKSGYALTHPCYLADWLEDRAEAPADYVAIEKLRTLVTHEVR